MFRALIFATSLVPFVSGSADAQCRCGTSSGYTYSAPVTGTMVAPPVAPMAGTTMQYRSVEPTRVMPPAAPTSGYTYRSYSVQPRYSTTPRYSTPRPQDDLILRKQHPGTYSFR
jgi:hypothetical protein